MLHFAAHPPIIPLPVPHPQHTPRPRLQSPIRQVTPTFFSDRSPAISQWQSRRIVAGLKRIGLVDRAGWVTADNQREDVSGRKGCEPGASLPLAFAEQQCWVVQAARMQHARSCCCLCGDTVPAGLPSRLASPLQDPQTLSYQWTKKLKRLVPWLSTKSRTLSLTFRASLLQQSLNVAYARHDAVSDYLTVCLAWLESQGQAHLPTLLQQYTVPGGNLTALTADRVYPALAPGPGEEPAPAAAPAPLWLETATEVF